MSTAPRSNAPQPLTRVLLKHPREAFRSQSAIDRQWRELGYGGPPEWHQAVEEYDRFVTLLEGSGAECAFLPSDSRTGLDSIYVRDAAVAANGGLILGRMGKPLRRTEPDALGEACRQLGIPILGAIEGEGVLEGGDVVWLDERTVAVGEGYRTNARGIVQLKALLAGQVDEWVVVPLPHWHGPGEVLHLMSLLSPIDRDLAVAFLPLLPASFLTWLERRGMTLVEVPETEFDSMGANVLAVSPRRCIILEGNPRVRAGLEGHGVGVATYRGAEISLKGSGGPTCLTQPLWRGGPQRATALFS